MLDIFLETIDDIIILFRKIGEMINNILFPEQEDSVIVTYFGEDKKFPS